MRIAAILVAAGSGTRFGAEITEAVPDDRRQAGHPSRRGGAGRARVPAATGRRRRTDRGRAARNRRAACRPSLAAPPARTACAPASRRWSRMIPTSCWCTTPPGPSSRRARSLPCWRRLQEAPGAIPAAPVADTLKRVVRGVITETVPRAGLFRAQTPQAFRFAALAGRPQSRPHGRDRRCLAAGSRRGRPSKSSRDRMTTSS